MNTKYILSIDQGTSSTKALIFDTQGTVLARASEPLHTFYLSDGFVEQNPQEIYENAMTAVRNCLADFQTKGYDMSLLKACGISNQRETFVLWDEQGNPLHNAVVWQCKRSVKVCDELRKQGIEPMIRANTGLLIDPYFSGTKLVWLYQEIPAIREAIQQGKAFFGTVDTWLLYKLTEGKVYATDYTNASRTLFFNIHTLQWDTELIAHMGLTGLQLPSLHPSAAPFGASTFEGNVPEALPITAMIGDSHAAAFGEGCFEAGTAKATLGTGCSILMNIGQMPQASQHGMVTTICWSTANRVDYALEGAIVSCGATIEWLKNELGLFLQSQETEAMAQAVEDNGGVYIIPAFSGLGAPYWDMKRKASIQGLTFGSTKNHLVRAALESIPYQIKDVVLAMQEDAGVPLQELMLNGGMTANTFVLESIANVLNTTVVNRGMPDVSALGAALLAGIGSELYPSIEAVKATLRMPKKTSPVVAEAAKLQQTYRTWKGYITAV